MGQRMDITSDTQNKKLTEIVTCSVACNEWHVDTLNTDCQMSLLGPRIQIQGIQLLSRIQLQGKLSLLALRWGKLWNFHSNVSTTDVTFLGIKPYCCSLMVISLQQLFIIASWHGSSDLSPSSYYSYAHNLSWKSVLLHSSGILTFKNCAKQTG